MSEETVTPKFPNIRHSPDYDGHWKGEAWFSGHPYGVQVHRTLSDAERWVEGRKALGLEHLDDCVSCCDVVEFRHTYRNPNSYQGQQNGEQYC